MRIFFYSSHLAPFSFRLRLPFSFQTQRSWNRRFENISVSILEKEGAASINHLGLQVEKEKSSKVFTRMHGFLYQMAAIFTIVVAKFRIS